MPQNPKLKIQFELTAKQKKILDLVLAREKVPAAEVCRRLLVNYLNLCRDSALTGVLPHVPQEPKPLEAPRKAGRRPARAKILHGREQSRRSSSLVNPFRVPSWCARSKTSQKSFR